MGSIVSGTAKLAAWTLAGAVLTSALLSSPTGLAGLRAFFLSDPSGAAPPSPAAPERVPPSAPVAQQAPESSFGDEVRLAAGADGNFHTQVEIDGVSTPMMVDTGASLVTLSFEEAERVGLAPPASEFRYVSQTANGRTYFAKVTLPYVRIGSIELANVVAAVAMRGALGQEGLLGMTFLGRLRSYQAASGSLTLKN